MHYVLESTDRNRHPILPKTISQRCDRMHPDYHLLCQMGKERRKLWKERRLFLLALVRVPDASNHRTSGRWCQPTKRMVRHRRSVTFAPGNQRTENIRLLRHSKAIRMEACSCNDRITVKSLVYASIGFPKKIRSTSTPRNRNEELFPRTARRFDPSKSLYTAIENGDRSIRQMIVRGKKHVARVCLRELPSVWNTRRQVRSRLPESPSIGRS